MALNSKVSEQEIKQCLFHIGGLKAPGPDGFPEVLHKFKKARGKVGFIAWKIDLAKAYDRLQWHFIQKVLNDIGIEGNLNRLIMNCVSSVQFKVIMNGETSNNFRPKSGIRQCDPLSPYLFVLCMEKLSHIINQKRTEGSWKPVKISRKCPAISHMFFADDLILFGQASMQQAQVMKDCLDIFCELSR
ncbi:hypothetical protein Dsin_014988 [Dipteronia sinensis]|uniref:Reverse transcriptase domain-containing protein n=1 Tax=Dipteronia sinensis TaxID=43782 RepID=A0AAE0EAB6_9ROSI|nr:hypothetical protein Dsin_014988 [Dipteronia sinensis]